jgi:hypothetical protein
MGFLPDMFGALLGILPALIVGIVSFIGVLFGL